MGNNKTKEVESFFYSKPFSENSYYTMKKVYLFEFYNDRLSIFKGYIFHPQQYDIKYESCEYEFKEFYKGKKYNRPLKIKKLKIEPLIEYLKPLVEDERFFILLRKYK